MKRMNKWRGSWRLIWPRICFRTWTAVILMQGIYLRWKVTAMFPGCMNTSSSSSWFRVEEKETTDTDVVFTAYITCSWASWNPPQSWIHLSRRWLWTRGKDGKAPEPNERPGRRLCQNVLTEAAGPTSHSKCKIKDALTGFLCVFDDGILKHIRDCTVAEAYRCHGDSSLGLTLAELKAFRALLYIHMEHRMKRNILGRTAWGQTHGGFPCYNKTMATNCFREMTFLRRPYTCTCRMTS